MESSERREEDILEAMGEVAALMEGERDDGGEGEGEQEQEQEQDH